MSSEAGQEETSMPGAQRRAWNKAGSQSGFTDMLLSFTTSVSLDVEGRRLHDSYNPHSSTPESFQEVENSRGNKHFEI